MDGIILDCNLMRYPHSGLYQYCLNLSERVNIGPGKCGSQTVEDVSTFT